ncbi:MAG: hypothetical protein Q4G21_04235 [Dermabacter sp.]|nr:hypothetical protein [Dermabacter sp.]
MAYRFNPPPNWPIQEPGWTPPEGWQPDPAWGPAPHDWNFWLDDDGSAAADAPGIEGPGGADIAAAGSAGSLAPSAGLPAAAPAAPSSYDYGSSEPRPAGGAAATQEYSGSAPEYSAPSAPASYSASGPGNGQEPPKGCVARFWWLGCIILAVLALIVGGIGLVTVMLLNNGSSTESDPTPSAGTPTASPTADPSGSSAPTAAAPADGSATRDIYNYRGKGKVTITTEWISNDNLPASSYDGTIEPATSGQYLAVTATVEATEGEVFFNPYEIEVKTPYGGLLDLSSNSYSQADGGLGGTVDYLQPGTTATMRVLYDVPVNGGLVVQWDGDDSGQTWEVPVP